jgi:hypothetical protein
MTAVSYCPKGAEKMAPLRQGMSNRRQRGPTSMWPTNHPESPFGLEGTCLVTRFILKELLFLGIITATSTAK